MIKRITILILFLIWGSVAKAVIIDHGRYLTDTESGLDWLKLEETYNMSISDVLAKSVPGGILEGWRYATDYEFSVLVGNYTGVPTGSLGMTIIEDDLIDGLITLLTSTIDLMYRELFGVTLDDFIGVPEGNGLDISRGILFLFGFGRFNTGELVDHDGWSPFWDYLIIGNYHLPSVDENDHQKGLSSFLVRGTVTSVPEPKSLALVVMGLGILAAFLSRRTELSLNTTKVIN